MFGNKTTTEVAADEKVCCALLDTSKWQHIQHYWRDKPFVKDTVPQVFHIPLPGTYNKAITRMWEKAEKAGAAPRPEDFLLLAYDPSAFKSELYMSVTKEVPGAENVTLSGTFYSKVFEGNYSEVPRCMKEMEEFLSSKELISKKTYIYFPYCPKCAKKYGHNYIVVLSEV